MNYEACIICGRGHDDREEVRQGDYFYHEECYYEAEPTDEG